MPDLVLASSRQMTLLPLTCGPAVPEFVALLPALLASPDVPELPDDLLFSSGVLSILTSLLDFLIRS